MTALSTDLQAAIDAGRAHTSRPEVRRLWDAIQDTAERSADPDGTFLALCDRLIDEADKIRAERAAATA